MPLLFSIMGNWLENFSVAKRQGWYSMVEEIVMMVKLK